MHALRACSNTVTRYRLSMLSVTCGKVRRGRMGHAGFESKKGSADERVKVCMHTPKPPGAPPLAIRPHQSSAKFISVNRRTWTNDGERPSIVGTDETLRESQPYLEGSRDLLEIVDELATLRHHGVIRMQRIEPQAQMLDSDVVVM